MPKIKIDPKHASRELLLSYIEGCNVQDSIEVYKILEEKGEKLPINIQQQLLEMVAYYNEGEEMQEDFNFTAGLYDEKQTSQWNAGGLAEKLCQNICNDEENEVSDEDKVKAEAVLMCGLVQTQTVQQSSTSL